MNIYSAFTRASSKGAFFNAQIQGNFAYTTV